MSLSFFGFISMPLVEKRNRGEREGKEEEEGKEREKREEKRREEIISFTLIFALMHHYLPSCNKN
jgi:hypothetical protein